MNGWSRAWTCRSEPLPGIDIETCQALELRDIDERLRIDALGVSGRP